MADLPNQSSGDTKTLHPNPNGGLILSPEINASGKPTQKAIKDASMAANVAKTLIQANRNRQIVNSRIMAKYNAERPYDAHRLEQEGLSWRSNFTTKPLPTMIDKVAPRFVEAVNGMKYLTNAELPPSVANSTKKTETFRTKITKLMRSRRGWRNLVEDIAQENALFGNTVASWLDEFTWFPKHFRQDEIFLSDGAKQLPSSAQVGLLKETYLPHELFQQIEDKESAETVGWDIKGTIESVNKASPAQLRDNLTGSGSGDAWYQNAQRELTLGASYMAGASVIVVYSLLVQEVDGTVSHYRLAGPELKVIFSKDNRFKSMEDCMAFFAFQKGNGTMHGSKGIGREIYEMAGMIDRTRNEVVDRAILSGKMVVQGNPKDIHKFKMSVVGMMCLVPSGWSFLDQKIDGNIEPFLKLDSYFSLLVDQLVGSVSPRNFGGERVTKAEVDLFASREEEGKDARIGRFLDFFVDMVAVMQRRICNPDVIDEDAKQFQKEMLEVMTREELDMLAEQPVAQTIKDLTPIQRQQVAAIAQEKRGNPLYNQRALEEEDLSARMSPEFAQKVLLPDQDPTEEAEQSRQQMIELNLLNQGQQIPVSPRDNHATHIAVLMPVIEQAGAALMQGQTQTPVFEALIMHLSEHYNAAEAAGAPKELLKPVKDILTKALPALEKLKQVDAAAQSVQQASVLHDQHERVAAPVDALVGGS